MENKNRGKFIYLKYLPKNVGEKWLVSELKAASTKIERKGIGKKNIKEAELTKLVVYWRKQGKMKGNECCRITTLQGENMEVWEVWKKDDEFYL